MSSHMPRPTFPWWRVPIVWLVIGGPAAVVAASIAMLVVALRSGDTPLHDMRASAPVQAAGTMVPAQQARNHAAAPRR